MTAAEWQKVENKLSIPSIRYRYKKKVLSKAQKKFNI